MTLLDAIKARHSVRAYLPKPIEPDTVSALRDIIGECNSRSGLHIQLITDEPDAFGKSLLAHYGKFRDANNYIAIVGDKRMPRLDELTGYYGERIVLEAQRLGLNTCWVALTYKKSCVLVDNVDEREKLVCVISIGYGVNPDGHNHRIKRPDQVSHSLLPAGERPEWFERGVAAALLAPTAINQQKFRFTLQPDGHTVKAEAQWGPYSKIDLGIVKLHFEIGAEGAEFKWEREIEK